MLHDPSDDLAMLPDWARKERPMASMLPYVSLVNDVTVRTRGNALFQCIRLDGVNSMTCLLYTSPSPRDLSTSRMPSSA